MLKDAGYVVDTATSIADGMDLYKQKHFDLCILDSRFADGTGIELCRQLRALDPRKPIIFYSGAGYATDIAAGLAAGAQEYLTKPLGLYTIAQTIARLLTDVKMVPVKVQREPSPIQL
jgi:DNA-binding response OmpR family regulator